MPRERCWKSARWQAPRCELALSNARVRRTGITAGSGGTLLPTRVRSAGGGTGPPRGAFSPRSRGRCRAGRALVSADGVAGRRNSPRPERLAVPRGAQPPARRAPKGPAASAHPRRRRRGPGRRRRRRSSPSGVRRRSARRAAAHAVRLLRREHSPRITTGACSEDSVRLQHR